MGVIQSSINNLISTIAIASKLSPEAQERAELRIEQRKLDKSKKATEEAKSALQKGTWQMGSLDTLSEAKKAEAEQAKHIFQLNPTKDTLNQYAEAKASSWGTDKLIKYSTTEDPETGNYKTGAKKVNPAKAAGQKAESKLKQEQDRVRNSEFFRKPTQSIEQDLKEIGGNI